MMSCCIYWQLTGPVSNCRHLIKFLKHSARLFDSKSTYITSSMPIPFICFVDWVKKITIWVNCQKTRIDWFGCKSDELSSSIDLIIPKSVNSLTIRSSISANIHKVGWCIKWVIFLTHVSFNRLNLGWFFSFV